MLLSEPYPTAVGFPHCNVQNTSSRLRQTLRYHDSVPQTSPFTDSSELEFEVDTGLGRQGISQYLPAGQSFPSQPFDTQTSLTGFNNIPTIALPRDVQAHQEAPFKLSSDTLALFGRVDQMNTDSSWLSAGQLTPRSATRFSTQHHRESSLSSLGSAGPASPYSHTTSHPHIAVADTTLDGIHGLPPVDDFSGNYQVATNTKSFPGQDTFYPNYPNYAPAAAAAHTTYSNNSMNSTRQQNNGRPLLPTPGFPHNSQQQNSNRPRPISVASSVADDSPATPVGEPDETEMRRKNAFNGIPKLDRTMTDIYSDELFNPNFTITSASPAQAHVSPTNEVFAQRLQAANSQHLSAVPSPASTASHGSPFRHGSPLAPAPSHDFSSGTSAHMVFGSSQQLREQRKAAQDAHAMRQQLAQDSNTGTPQTISPKDAVIHTPEDGEADFPLFPKEEGDASFTVSQMDHVPQTTQSFNMPADARAFAYAAAQATANLATPQQYSFLPPVHQPQSQTQSSHLGTTDSRQSSADAGQSESSQDDTGLQRPMGTTADGGTYTCTYHGCTLRFDTPALLQKHKREGHRNAHGITGSRRSESVGLGTGAGAGADAGAGMTSALLNTQAGPHKCERINPSTNKPCNIMFSRPYDLTRHEDTIHNARKQKVRCDLCNEEKTFSRADALTRHYRVCHPHHEVPGKHRRRGGQQHV